MRFFSALALALSLILPTTSQAETVVVMELFTSQGCSSCPPADRLAAEMAVQDENIIALGWHVDYWDYLGWKDTFSSPANTQRQAGYRDRWHLRSLYTPQMVVSGRAQMVGSHRAEVRNAVQSAKNAPQMVEMNVNVNAGTATVRITSLMTGLPEADIILIRVIPDANVEIGRGENAGRTVRYVNVVANAKTLGEWDGARDIDVTDVDISDGTYVLLVQAKGFGPILGASYLR